MPSDSRAPVLHYQGRAVACRENESVLDAFLREGVNIAFSCKSGVCHRCMVRCVDGDIPPHAQRKLPAHQRAAGCLLSCQCYPTGSMMLAPRSPEDSVTRCRLVELNHTDNDCWQVTLEPFTNLNYRSGQLARLMSAGLEGECGAVFVSSPDDGGFTVVELNDGSGLPDWLRQPVPDDLEFCLRGPLPVEQSEPVTPLPPEPALWDELGGDAAVRAVLATFYDKVYADPELRPFFERVTIDRIIGKQFSFLKQHIKGEPGFLGEQPHNAHNWMVITDVLFDHRQSLMLRAMREHDIDEGLIARWSRYEEQFRPDIVKYKPWLKRLGDLLVDTEQYEACLLEEATVCDYCSGEIPANTQVRYHKRIGKLACDTCSSPVQPAGYA